MPAKTETTKNPDVVLKNPDAISLDSYNLAEMEKTLVQRAAAKHKTHREAADSLGITRTAFKRRMVKYGLVF